jgi:hypothetical protein
MKIVGYCALLAIALALFIAMCAILRDSIITHNISVRGQAVDGGIHAAEPAAAPVVSARQ